MQGNGARVGGGIQVVTHFPPNSAPLKPGEFNRRRAKSYGVLPVSEIIGVPRAAGGWQNGSQFHFVPRFSRGSVVGAGLAR